MTEEERMKRQPWDYPNFCDLSFGNIDIDAIQDLAEQLQKETLKRDGNPQERPSSYTHTSSQTITYKLTTDEIIKIRHAYWVELRELRELYQEYKTKVSQSFFYQVVRGVRYTSIPMPAIRNREAKKYNAYNN